MLKQEVLTGHIINAGFYEVRDSRDNYQVFATYDLDRAVQHARLQGYEVMYTEQVEKHNVPKGYSMKRWLSTRLPMLRMERSEKRVRDLGYSDREAGRILYDEENHYWNGEDGFCN